MKIINVLLVLISFALSPQLLAQKCKHQGHLLWIQEMQLVQKPIYNASENIQGLIYNPTQKDSLRIDLKVGKEEMSLMLPVQPLKDFSNLSIYHQLKGQYSKVDLIPSPYPKTVEAYQKLALAICKSENKQLTIHYRATENPISGCIDLELSNGFGQYDLRNEIQALEQLNKERADLLARIKQLEEQEAEKLNYYEIEKDRRNLADQQRQTLEERHKNLSVEEQEVLADLIQQSNQVGVALNQAVLSNDKAMAIKVADLTGDYQKRLAEVKQSTIYKQIQNSFDNYYRQSTIYFTHDRNISKLDLELRAIREKIKQAKAELETKQ
jgi:hypothetical protein